MLVLALAVAWPTVAPAHVSRPWVDEDAACLLKSASLLAAATVQSNGAPRSVYDAQRSSTLASEIEKANKHPPVAASVGLPTREPARLASAQFARNFVPTSLQADHVRLQI
ncbi:MAG: hypothetical protein JSS27_15390 [Planctomycetes bacterium]|nr:hypothetical protein [Planctomycetota bacterium]